jgi:DNA-directed RNA polymerase subunit delta
MKLKNISKEDLELMSFDDIAYIIIKEKGKKIKITDLFKTICDMLNLGEKAYTEQIGDFFTLLSTEKRFIQLDKGFWDLRENHTTKIDINSIYDDLADEDIITEESTDEEEINEDDYDEVKDMEDDTVDDDYKDFAVIDEEEDAL